jgi:hypothetical protein
MVAITGGGDKEGEEKTERKDERKREGIFGCGKEESIG